MEIQSEHHIDASEKDENGDYSYYYAFTDFVVDCMGLKVGFRLYDDDSCLFVKWIEDEGVQKRVNWGQSYGSITITFPRDSVLMKEILTYFRGTFRVRAVKAYDGPIGAYSEVTIEELL